MEVLWHDTSLTSLDGNTLSRSPISGLEIRTITVTPIQKGLSQKRDRNPHGSEVNVFLVRESETEKESEGDGRTGGGVSKYELTIPE